MTTKKKYFYHNLARYIIGLCVISCIGTSYAATVAARGKPTAAKNAARASTASTASAVAKTATVASATAQETANETDTSATDQEYIQPLQNKSGMFNDVFGGGSSDDDDEDTSDMLARIAAFRAGVNNQDTKNKNNSAKHNANKCDQDLRQCMANKCGSDFRKCAGDGDTAWGDKLDACRRDTTCTGHEYALFAPEIKADRDIMQQLSLYESIMNCGNKYNNCIISECGSKFNKCIEKKASDSAIKKCQQIAKECQEQDSGLSARAMEAMATARNTAEYTIAHDEKRLYSMRDKMRETCTGLGAAFDERTFSCVFTVNFRAGDDDSVYASKKAYAGSTFNCDQNWFGVDITTFMENAFRLTREQKSASSALLGSGIGVGVGALTSGAIDRATDRAKAERAYGQELCEQTKGTWNKTTHKCKCKDSTYTYDDEKGCQQDEDAKKQKTCTDSGGKWIKNKKECNCKNAKDTKQSEDKLKCEKIK